MSPSERTPLLPTHAQPSDQTVQKAKETAFALSKAVGALKAGKLPSQSQLDKLIDAALKSDVLSLGSRGRTGRLSDDGARVLTAFKAVLEAVERVGDEKNGDDKVQSILYNLTQVEPPSPPPRGHALDASTSSTLPSRKEIDKDSHAALNSLQKILRLFLTSSQFRLVVNQGISFGASILADASGEVAKSASKLEKEARNTGSDDTPIDIDSQKQKGKELSKGLRSGRIQGQAREDLMNQFESLGNYFEDKISGEDEAKDKLFEKLKAVIVDVQSNQDYQSSIDTILNLIKKYYSKAEKIADEATEKVKEDADQSPLQEALSESKELIEAFAGDASLDPVLDAAKKLKVDIEKNHEVEKYFSDIGNFIEACLKVEGYVTTQRAYRRSSQLWDRGQKLLQGDKKYKEDIDELVSSLEDFGDALADDPATSDLASKVEDLSDEIIRAGKTGVNALKAESAGLWRDVIDVVIPRAIALVKEIPAPRTEFKSEDVDFVIDDISFESASFIPDNIRFVNHNDLSLSQGYAAFAADYDSSIKLHVDGLKFAAKDISYWLSKKTGWLTFEDEGLLDLAFDNKGISFDVTLENASESDRESFFVVKDVQVDISDLTYSISNNSSWLIWFSKPFVSGLLKKNLKDTLEAQIASNLRDADLQLYGLQQRTIAATNAKPSPANYLKAIFNTSVFSSGSTSKITQKGVVKHGRRGEYLLAIGVDEQIFPGKAGPTAAYSKRHAAYVKSQKAVDQAKSVAGQAKSAIKGGSTEVEQTKIDANREASKLGLTIKDQTKKESRKDGWRSDAFDI